MDHGELRTANGRSKVLAQLVDLHTGEIAELYRQRTTWHFRRRTSSSDSKDWLNPRWYCCPDGKAVGRITMRPGKDEYGQSPLGCVWSNIRRQATFVSNNSRKELDANDLMPDWTAQCNSCIVPCRNVDTHEWLRVGPVITLGELFVCLGEACTAKAVYVFSAHAAWCH